MEQHIPCGKKKRKKKHSFKNKKPKSLPINDGISKKKSNRRHNNYAWNKAIEENLERLRKIGEE